jgi:hypothetical protein
MQPPPPQTVTKTQAVPACDPAPTGKPQANTLLDTLPADGDVYAFTVRSIIKCKTQRERRHHAQPVVALLATFALQMGLLILLWKALTTGSKTGISTPDDILKDIELEKKLSLLAGTVDQVRDIYRLYG